MFKFNSENNAIHRRIEIIQNKRKNIEIKKFSPRLEKESNIDEYDDEEENDADSSENESFLSKITEEKIEGEKGKKWNCPTCGEPCAKSYLTRHMRLNHKEDDNDLFEEIKKIVNSYKNAKKKNNAIKNLRTKIESKPGWFSSNCFYIEAYKKIDDLRKFFEDNQ